MIAITADGHELLTPGLPYTAQEIEAAMSTQPREATRLQALQARAAKFGSVISAPAFETTRAQLDATVKNAIRDADLALDRIARRRRGDLTFASTVGALERGALRGGERGEPPHAD